MRRVVAVLVLAFTFLGFAATAPSAAATTPAQTAQPAADLPDLPGPDCLINVLTCVASGGPGMPGGDLLQDGLGNIDPLEGDFNPVDCAHDIVIGSPNAGPANGIDGGPETPRAGTPFGDKPTSTIYEQYGYGGLTWPSIKSDCGAEDLPGKIGETAGKATDPGGSATGSVANIGLSGLALVVGIIGATLRFAFAPDTFDIFDPVLTFAAEALGETVFEGLFWITLMATAILIAFSAHKGSFKDSAGNAGWVTMAGMIGLVAMTWPLVVAPMFDDALTSTVGGINSAVATRGGGVNALDGADGATANLHSSLLYETWCAGMVGRSSGDTAEKFCPRLFAASTFSREEVDAIKGDNTKAMELATKKNEDFNTVATELRKYDPPAGEYLDGKHNTERFWYAALGWVGLFCAAPFVFMAALLLIYALITIRIAIMVAPVIATVGGFPPLRKYLVSVFDYVVGAFATALIFGTLAAVFIGLIGAFMSPATNVHPLLSMLLLLASTVAAWKFTKPFRKVKELGNLKKRFKKVQFGWPDSADLDLGNATRTSDGGPSADPGGSGARWVDSQRVPYDTPAEARQSVSSSTTKSAIAGAAAPVMAGIATGGAATVGMVAAGAVSGVMQNRNETAHEAPSPTVRALPAGPRAAEPQPRVYDPGEVSKPVRVVNTEPTRPDNDVVYPIYVPSEEARA